MNSSFAPSSKTPNSGVKPKLDAVKLRKFETNSEAKLWKEIKSPRPKPLALQRNSGSTKGVAKTEESAKTFKNPMLILPIIVNLMGMFSLEDLKRCRLVCRVWNQLANDAIADLNYVVNFSNSNKVAQFAQTMKKNPMISFCKFCLKNRISARIQAHFQELGLKMKTLYIEVDDRARISAKDLVNFYSIHVILSSTPNLERLGLENIEFPNYEYSSEPDLNPSIELVKLKTIRINTKLKNLHLSLPSSSMTPKALELRHLETIKKLFRAAPNLSTVELNMGELTVGTTNEFNALLDILRRLSQVEKFSLESRMERYQLELLMTGVNFKPKSLRIHQSSRRADVPNLFPGFLKKYADTLKVLDISFSWDKSPISETPTPTLRNVKHLILRFDSTNSGRCFKINFLPSVQLNLPSLKKLYVYGANCDILTGVFKSFKYIEDLSILSICEDICTDINMILSGIPEPKRTSKALRSMKKNETNAEVDVFLKLTLLSSDPSLRDMKSLKRLELWSGNGNSKINGMTAQFALLEMQPLEVLKLKNCQLGKRMIKSLKAHHGVVELA